jgi:hypothetical protein
MLVRNRHFSLRGLAAVAVPVPPFPKGVSVAGTGPGGSATTWQTAYYPSLGVWVANTGFGLAPIYRAADWLSLLTQDPAHGVTLKGHLNHMFAGAPSTSTLIATDDSGAGIYGTEEVGPYSLTIDTVQDLTRIPMLMVYNPGAFLVITTSDGGTQNIDYRLDSTGYYVPAHAQGIGKGGMSLFDTLIMAGAMIGAAVASAGAAFGATTPGIGAEAVGGSAAAAGTAAPGALVADVAAVAAPVDVASTTAPEIATFVPPPIASVAPIDAATLAPIDVSAVAQTAAAAATSPLTGAFSVAKYVQTLAGLYKTVTGLTAGAAPHPQAGTVTILPDGSRSVVNPDGSTTVYDPTGVPVTVGWNGQVAAGAYQAPQTAGLGLVGGVVLALAALGMMFNR